MLLAAPVEIIYRFARAALIISTPVTILIPKE